VGVDITCQRETLTRVLIDELRPMLLAHAVESAPWMAGDAVKLDLDPHIYLESLGRYRLVVARLGGAALGYNALMIDDMVGYSGRTLAQECGMYVSPTSRGNGVACRLLAAGESQLEGVDAVHRFVPIGSAYGRLLEGLGYEPTATVYTRRLVHEKSEQAFAA
jgi:hypothetical protein